MQRLLRAVMCVLCSLGLGTVAPASAGVPDQQTIRTGVRGHVVDSSGAVIVGAQIIATPHRPSASAVATTDQQGEYEIALGAGAYTLTATANGFHVDSRAIIVGTSMAAVDFQLAIGGIQESVSVGATIGYDTAVITSATRTPTPLLNVPQAVSVVSAALIADQRMTSMADVTRYMPGVGFAQGEGNRDTPILRGNSTTSDFFVNGIRDDAQYFRDVYNVERVEALKGPNAMVFGRGGVGGVINRVTRQADWGHTNEAAVQFGSWGNRRVTADVGRGLDDTIALRATGMYENSDSYRDGLALERYGFNPTAAFHLGAQTTVRASYEYFHDERTGDRGVSSFHGRPLDTDPGTFFGDPDMSPTHATVNVASTLVEHRFHRSVTLTNRTSYTDYDKFYQNVFPGAVNAAGTAVSIAAYNSATGRQNIFNQTDFVVSARTGRIGHTLLLGGEVGRQQTANFRNTGYFTGVGANVTSFITPIGTPRISEPVAFRQRPTDTDNQGVTHVAGVYVQDQIALTNHLQSVVGLRFDSFKATVRNNRTGADFASNDGLLSPRLGLIYKPVPAMSIYGSYSLTYLPRAGEQLASLSVTNQALDPEEFRNYEVGAKWDVRPGFSTTVAVYRLDRGNVVVPDPSDPTVSLLVDAQRTKGVEVGLNGNLTRAWTVAGGYAWQDGTITRSISATAAAGAWLAQLPRHSLSLWNRYDVTPRLAGAVGLLTRSHVFTSTDNTVTLPGWVRVDAAVFYKVSATIRAQVNVENLFDERYFSSAHGNNNISPGSPRAVRVALTTRF